MFDFSLFLNCFSDKLNVNVFPIIISLDVNKTLHEEVVNGTLLIHSSLAGVY